jgi:hypothetical protein
MHLRALPLLAGAALSALVLMPDMAAARVHGTGHHGRIADAWYRSGRPRNAWAAASLGFNLYGASDYYATYYPYPGYDSYYGWWYGSYDRPYRCNCHYSY